ncbi:glycosyltransferase family 2 protein [Flavobacterium hiemivividum]|uniref:Glycosyltransferase n=1 Tax=Flavobacterium hiemivividum TaxID=2541734 RepID=A0A4R5D2P7_9FLAO|nr:glycosyltransferase family 2 protein [Flavobacterium hiemivividum]TDE04555.1 glycosyltransferase [Flavobacterium hiemivividum]
MKISIITVVYNNDRTIKDALQSVLSQDYKNIEYIVIDGKSTDNTVNLITDFKDRLAYFISEKDSGIYDAMNKGIRAATGDVVGILNSDDLYEDSGVIAAVMEQFNIDLDLDILYGDLVYVKSDDTNKVIRNWKSKAYYNQFFENANVPPHPSLFVKKKVYDEAGLFDLDYKIAADYEFMLRIFKKHNFNSKYFNKLIVRMRLGGASNAGLSSVIKQNKEVLNAWKKNNLNKPFYLMPLRVLRKLAQFLK